MTDLLTHRIAGPESAELLVLLNGGMMSIAAWDRIAVPLEASYRVLRCDFRGQLLSPGEPAPHLDAHVDDLLALLDALAIERIHLAGVSFGALVALRLAALRPERAASLTAVSATERVTDRMWQETAEMREIVREVIADEINGDGGRVLDFLLPRTYTAQYLEAQSGSLGIYRQWVAALPQVWFRGLEQILSSLEGLDLTPHLGAIRCPALIVTAEGDRTFPPEHARALAAGIDSARLEIVPGGSHGLVIEQSERVLEILLSFLGSLRADS